MPQGRPKLSDQGLLEAGLSLASESGLADLTVDAVIDRAGTGKGTFYRHFGDRRGFLLAMHAELRRRIWAAVTDAMAGQAPGADRLECGLAAYLDACLANRALKAFVTEARVVPQVATTVEEDMAAAATVVADDLAALGWSDAPAAAQLVMAMAHEIALTEHREATSAHRLRETLSEIATRPTVSTS